MTSLLQAVVQTWKKLQMITETAGDVPREEFDAE